MTTEETVRMVAGECLCAIEVAELAIQRCGSAREAIAHLSTEGSHDWRRRFYGS